MPLTVDQGAFTRDLYRPICMVLADQQIADQIRSDSAGEQIEHVPGVINFRPIGPSNSIATLRNLSLTFEVTRILVSCAVGLRIQFDQRPEAETINAESNCGELCSDLISKKGQVEVLNCARPATKIIHTTKVQFNEGGYMQPHVDLYGKKNSQNWRAKLSIVDFVKWGAAVFMV